MADAQLQCIENKGLVTTEVAGPPNFIEIAIARSNMLENDIPDYFVTIGADESVCYTGANSFVRNVPFNVINGELRGMRFTSTSATTSEVQDWTFYHKASNTGSNSLITTQGNQLTLLSSGTVGDTGSYSTNWAGFRILSNNTAYSLMSCKGGTGAYKSILFQTGASTTSQLTIDTNGNFFPTTTNQNTLGTATKEWQNVYSKTGITVNCQVASTGTAMPLLRFGLSNYGIYWDAAAMLFSTDGTESNINIACGTIEALRRVINSSTASPTFVKSHQSHGARALRTNTYNSGVANWDISPFGDVLGYEFEVINLAASQNLKLTPGASEQIVVPGVGTSTASTGYVTLTPNTLAKLVKVTSTLWVLTYQGTVTVA